MGNTSNRDQWAARERLRFVERAVWWRGLVNRSDLREVFGISAAQASADLQAYLELNPGALAYNLTTKRYEASAGMGCMLHEPRLSDALAIFLGSGAAAGLESATGSCSGAAGDRVARVGLPVRQASAQVERSVFRAVWGGLWLRMRYASLSGRGAKGWRRVAPRAFAHDGYRWHLRAWCEDNGGYRDFVLSRVAEAEWPTESASADLPRDEAWESFEELELVPNPNLSEDRRAAVAADYGAKGGVVRLRVRRALLGYTLRHLGLEEDGFGTLPALLVRARNR